MDVDLRQVRAFVALAEHEHFGRAAHTLAISQQALSKRVGRLEAQLGILFDRHPGGVVLTERGTRLLPPARRLLEAADHALGVALDGETGPTLRVDVWGGIDPPEAIVSAFADAHPDADVEVSRRNSLPAALSAVSRRALDVAFGNVAHHPSALVDGLVPQLVGLTPLSALVRDAEAAGLELITPTALRELGLATPGQGSRAEFRGFLAEYAAHIGAHTTTQTRNANYDQLVTRVGVEGVTLVPATWRPPVHAEARVLPVEPLPLFPWYAIWRDGTPNPLVRALLQFATRDDECLRVPDGAWIPDAVRGLLRADRQRLLSPPSTMYREPVT